MTIDDPRPADTHLWWQRQEAGEPTPWSALEVTFLPPGATPADLLDTSYLTAEDRANPEIMANVEAIAQTAALIEWASVEPDRAVGYWRGPAGTPPAQAPVVTFDSEGQFHLAGATSVTELYAHELEEMLLGEDDDVLAERGLLDEDGDIDDDALRAELTRIVRDAGFDGEVRSIYDWTRPEVEIGPEDFHAERASGRG